jgi:hypothetical protein
MVEDRQPQGSSARLGEATRVGNFSEQNRGISNERHQNASSMFMISCRADLVTVSGQLSRPSPGSYMTVSGQLLVAAVSPRCLDGFGTRARASTPGEICPPGSGADSVSFHAASTKVTARGVSVGELKAGRPATAGGLSEGGERTLQPTTIAVYLRRRTRVSGTLSQTPNATRLLCTESLMLAMTDRQSDHSTHLRVMYTRPPAPAR